LGCFERLEARRALSLDAHECRLADVDDSGTVDAADVAVVAANYGLAAPRYNQGDVDGDAAVGVGDLAAIQRKWGAACEPASVRFAAFGDYGDDSPTEAAVAALVKSWNVDLIVTLGDNNYGIGAAETIDANVGKYFQEFIGDYAGDYGPGTVENRFFPSIGNHDWWVAGPEGVAPYLDYFNLPGAGFESTSGNERYYEFVWGPVHFFALDSSLRETDGRTATSKQGDWLRRELAASTTPWQVVFFHESPYSSGSDSGSTLDMQWPFRQWGADLVLSAHDHNYERLLVGGLTYLVAGTGGAPLRDMNPLVPGSQVTYNEAHGALLIEADANSLRAEFRSIVDDDTLVDCVARGEGECPPPFNDSPPAARIAAAEVIVVLHSPSASRRPVKATAQRIGEPRSAMERDPPPQLASVAVGFRRLTAKDARAVRRAVNAELEL
jgi:hypothetical protein